MVKIEFKREVGPKGRVVIPGEVRSLKQFLSIIPVEKRKRIKVKDFDEWYEGELGEKWRRIERAISRR